MKRFLTSLAALAVALGALTQCKPYDDSWIREELDGLKAQVANLQKSVDALDAYRTLLDKSRLISEVRDHGDGTFTIYFADGTAPVTLDAGKGDPGKDGVTPDFKIQDGNWYVSYDGGATWAQLGSASGGDDFFKSVSLEGDYLVLVLIDGTRVRINLKGGQGGSGDDEPSGATPRDYWPGNWVIGPAGYQFDVEIVESGDGFALVWNTDVRIPLEYETATGNLLLKMTENRWIGASADGDTNYYLNLYDKSGARINPEQGALICTIARQSDDYAGFTSADSNYNGFYARPYVTSTGKWGTSTFWFDVESGLTRGGSGGGGGGGDDPSGAVTKADWIGTWKGGDGSITFYESGSYFMCYAPDSNFNGFGIQFTLNADGTASFVDEGYYGWCGTGEGNTYYYFAPYKGNTAVDVKKGDEVLKGTLSADKKTLTFTSGMEGVTRVLWFTGSTWGTAPSNWIGTFTKQ